MSGRSARASMPGALRRPSDLRLERGARPRQGSGADRSLLSWPSDFVRTQEDRDALIVLLHLSSLTAQRVLDLAHDHRSAASCLEAVHRGEAASPADQWAAASVRLPEVGARMEAVDARLVAVGDPEYPPELLDLFDPPAGLFVRGRPLEELVPRVAMVGARNCSPVGREVAGALASGLARAGVCLVSGGARGIDAAAHQGALRAEGRTISVLGCGIDIVYPGENRDLLQDVVAAGAVVSEYPPGTPAEPFRFPARNRIVAALSRAVVVVEGATGSGSRITAEHALDLGREVFAVPGSVASPLAAIPLDLIRDGATLVRGPDDLLSDLGLSPLPSNRMLEEDLDPGGVVGDRSLQQAERMVWAALTAPSAPDALARAAGLSLPEVVSALVGLEIRGQVRQVGGRYERRLEGSA